MGADYISDLFGEGCGVSDFGARDDEALEFVVPVFVGVMMVVVIVIMMMVVIVVIALMMGMVIVVVVVMHFMAGV